MKPQKTTDHQSSSNSVAPVVLFGLDKNGKPKAARFADKHATLATKAAGPMDLHVLAITDPRIAEVAAHLPAGRIHANGRGFVPFIRQDLYAKLVAAAGTTVAAGKPAAHSAASAGPSDSSSDSKGDSGHRPLDWDQIAPGDLVIAQDSLPDGWYAAIVVERNGDMLTLRWRDYPRERRISVHRFAVGLLYPGSDSLPAQEKQATQVSSKDQKTSAGKKPTAEPGKADERFPQSWNQIDVDHLVLAKEDGPWRTWWEAIPVENNGDVLTLRWRDHSYLPNIVRQRFDLALLYPKTQ